MFPVLKSLNASVDVNIYQFTNVIYREVESTLCSVDVRKQKCMSLYRLQAKISNIRKKKIKRTTVLRALKFLITLDLESIKDKNA